MTGLTPFQQQDTNQRLNVDVLSRILHKANKRKRTQSVTGKSAKPQHITSSSRRHVKGAISVRKSPVSTFEMLERLEENLEHLKPREARRKRRELRQRLRQERAERRIQLREDRKVRRLEARNQRKTARISKRNAKRLKKIYGDLNPEELNEINKIQPYTGAMKEELNKQGVELENPDDPIEVAAKYTRLNPDAEQPVEDEVIDDAYSDQDVDGFEGYENFKIRKGRAKGVIRMALATFGGALTGLTDAIEEKSASGQELTPTEVKILEAKSAAIDQAKVEAAKSAQGSISTYLPYAAFLILAVLIITK